MHTEQNAPFLKLFPHKHPSLIPPTTHPTTTHEFIGAFYIQITPLGDPSIPVVMHYWKGLFRTYTTTIVL